MTAIRLKKERLMAPVIILTVLIFIMGTGNFLLLRHIRSQTELLISQNLPLWAMAGTLYRLTAETGYAMASYEQHADPATWETAWETSEICMENIRTGQSLARNQNSVTFQSHMDRMDIVLTRYQDVMQRSRNARESIMENRKTMKRSSSLFLESIRAYNRLQDQEMNLQIAAAFGKGSLVRYGLDLSSEQELKIRHSRIQAGNTILNRGHTLYTEIWEAETRGDIHSLSIILPDVQEVHDSMSELLKVTRQPQNLQLLQRAMAALENNMAAVHNLILARQHAEKATAIQKASYHELLSTASEIASEAHARAIYGNDETRRILRQGLTRPLQLAVISIVIMFFFLFLHYLRTEKNKERNH
ncbi:hypothetical protein OOT00_14570 [Desulfobotulus sp. H1]|uniref:Nitrate/nitrite sensing protein domain-containing protein n=1 Tax=Desulfobotulus pelophilus TaxID=2823377 RepID=A0ABT3NCN7_9BACT|nr:hypothetical protein [Desulfobotulus pelophilus]MCW7755209.1 hypothetical protein [Desulfobotulus pelophilus]